MEHLNKNFSSGRQSQTLKEWLTVLKELLKLFQRE